MSPHLKHRVSSPRNKSSGAMYGGVPTGPLAKDFPLQMLLEPKSVIFTCKSEINLCSFCSFRLDRFFLRQSLVSVWPRRACNHPIPAHLGVMRLGAVALGGTNPYQSKPFHATSKNRPVNTSTLPRLCMLSWMLMDFAFH